MICVFLCEMLYPGEEQKDLGCRLSSRGHLFMGLPWELGWSRAQNT